MPFFCVGGHRGSAIAARTLCTIWLMLALASGASPAQAEEYRLATGDTVELYIDGELSLDRAHVIDLDGAVPVEFAGPVAIGGLTLAEAKVAIADELTARGLVVEPDVMVVVTAYRDIYVGGSVKTPGAYPYQHRLTVGQAVAIAGGPRSLLTDSAYGASELFRYHDAVASLQDERRTLMRAVLSLQRVEAQLDGKTEVSFTPPDDLEVSAEVLEAAIVDARAEFALMEAEMAALEAEAAENTTNLEEELETVIERKKELGKLVDILNEELLKSQDLVNRGLRTQETIVRSQQNLSAARVDLLEMERAQTIVKQRLAEVRTDLANEKITRDKELHAEHVEHSDQINESRARIRAFKRQVALYPGLLEATAGDESTPSLVYEVERRVGDRSTRSVVDDSFVLAPGDLVIVSTEATRQRDISGLLSPASN